MEIIKKILLVSTLIFFIVIQVSQISWGALTLKDDFTRANSTVLSDSSHHWIEHQSLGEAVINNNRMEISVNSGTRNFPNSMLWLDDWCPDSGCTISVKIGHTSAGTPTTTAATGIVIATHRVSAYLTIDGDGFENNLTLRRGKNGTVSLSYQNQGNAVNLFSEGVTGDDLVADVLQEGRVTLYKSGSDTFMDACWGPADSPCNGTGAWTKTAYNITQALGGINVPTYGYMGVYQYDNTGTAQVWVVDDWKLDIPETLQFKPWLSGLSSTGITVHVRANSTSHAVKVRYGTDPMLSSYTETSSVTPAWDGDLIAKINISSLAAGTTYYYKVVTGSTIDANIYSFKTLPTVGSAANFRFAVISCYDNNVSAGGDPAMTFAPLIKTHNPDFALLLGDNGYLDGGDDKLSAFSEEHVFRLIPNLANLWPSLPVFAIYDDHDSGMDDGYGAGEYINYTAGTVTVTNGSTTVTGDTSALWDENIPRTGNASPTISFKVAGNDRVYKVTSITPGTPDTLTLGVPYHEASASGVNYQVNKPIYWTNQWYPYYYVNPAPPTGYDADANYYSFQVGRVKFWASNMMMYSDNYGDSDNSTKDILGDNQIQWLSDTYKTDTAALKFLMFGKPLSFRRSGTLEVTYSVSTYELNQVLSMVSNATENTVLFSGDAHVIGYMNPDVNPHVLEVNSSRAARGESPLIDDAKTGWYYPAGNAFVIVDVEDNGVDITSKISFYDMTNTLLRTVYWSSSNNRALLCSYDANTCPNGRKVR